LQIEDIDCRLQSIEAHLEADPRRGKAHSFNFLNLNKAEDKERSAHHILVLVEALTASEPTRKGFEVLLLLLLLFEVSNFNFITTDRLTRSTNSCFPIRVQKVKQD